MHNLKVLFEKAKIKYIVSVDDCYDPSILVTNFDIKEFSKEDKSKLIDFCSEHSLEEYSDELRELDDSDYIDSLIDKIWSEKETELVTFFTPLIEIEKNGLENFCENLKNDEIIIDYVTIHNVDVAKEYYGNIESCFNIDSENRILWLIDNDFSKTGGSKEGGKVLIRDLISIIKEGHIFALSSAQTSDTDNNTIFRESLDLSNANDILLTCLIRKYNIIFQQYNELYNEMYLGFRQNYSGEILKTFHDVTENAAIKSCESISSLSDEAIHKVIFLGSKVDGISPIETFQRLMMIVLKSDISKSIGQNYDKISKLIYNYSELCSWCDINKNTDKDFNIIESLRKSEYYDKNINMTYAPIGYGDIFEINSKYYLLIAQSCNVSIRDDGKRKANCATLVEIKSDTTSTKSTIYLDYFDNQINSYVSFNDTINVDFSVLDLCTINSDGSLFLSDDFDIDIVEFRYTYGSLQSLINVIQHNRVLKGKYIDLQQKKNELSITEVIEKTREIYKDNTLELLADFENGIRYNGYRVCRLNKDIMDDISRKYAEYHSRKALDFDFAANFKPITFDLIYNLDLSLLEINEAQFNFMTQYTYYKTEHFDNDKSFRKDIEKQFATYYKNLIKLNQDEDKLCGHKSEIDKRTIDIPNKWIPVVLNNITYIDILDVKDTKIHIKLPKKIIGDKLVNKSNGTHNCNCSNSTMKISQHVVTFIFELGQPFEFKNLDYVNENLSFNLSHNGEFLVLSL